MIGLILAGAVLAYQGLAASGGLDLLADSARLRERVSELGYWGPVGMVVLMAVPIVLSPLPSAPIALAAGAAYGHTWGTVTFLAPAARPVSHSAIQAIRERWRWTMMHRDGREICPVCGMKVAPGQYAIEYMQMHFAFCSGQCRERFLDTPHLYIGYPGQKAPGQEGLELIRRRRIRLAQPLTAEMRQRLTEGIRSMMGIREVRAEGQLIDISYDLVQATEAQIESQLEALGATLGEGWGECLRRAFVHYLEQSLVENLQVQPGPHRHGH